MIHWNHFPRELTQRDQWCLTHAGSKAPRQLDGHHARANDPLTWAPFAEVKAACALDPTLGVEYMLSPQDGLVVIDLDHVRDPETRLTAPWAWELLLMASTYTECSPSRTGYHLIGRGQWPASRRQDQIEVYTRTHAITMTGDTVSGVLHQIQDIQPALDLLRDHFFTAPAERATEPVWAPPLDTLTVLQRALFARNGEKVRRLYAGEQAGYTSPSEADLALCCQLAFWTRDPAQIDAIVRLSARHRPKWDEAHSANGETYGAQTIKQALARSTTAYRGQPGPPTLRAVEVPRVRA